MTIGQKHAEERGPLSFEKSRGQPAGILAMVGLIAALTSGGTVYAQSATPEPRQPAKTPPPAAAPATSPRSTPSADTAGVPAPAERTTTVTTPGTLPATMDTESAAAVELAPAAAKGEERPLAPKEKREVTDKLAEIDARYDQMNQERSERSRLTVPISLMSAGYATATAALTGAMVGFVKANSVSNYDGEFETRLDFDNNDIINGDDEEGYRRLARTAGLISAVGYGFGIWGTVMLVKRLKERSDYEPELLRMQQERKQLRRQLDYSANATGKALTLTVSGRF